MTIVGFASTEHGSKHYRCELPARVLALAGDFDVIVGGDLMLNPPPQPAPIGIAVGADERIPHVMVLAGGYPAGLGFAVIDAARASGQRIICDIDDWPEIPHENPHYLPELAGRKLAALRAADAVTCSTPTLRDYLLTQGIGSTLIRNTIDRDRYRFERGVNIARRIDAAAPTEPPTDDAPPVVVGYRGMLAGFHDADVRELAGLADRFGAELEHFRFVHVGADPRGVTFAELTGLPAELVEDRPAVAFDQYGPALAGIDVGIIPFADRPFTRAKSNVAALEWHAAGVPWLASRHPEFTPLPGRATIADRRDWPGRLRGLIDPFAREALYEAQRFTPAPIAQRWAKVVLSTMRVAA